MDRRTVFAVVEGYSESGFLSYFLGPHLGELGVDLTVKIVGEGNSKGGMKFRTFEQTCSELVRHLKDRRRPHVTTFFDYYGLPTSEAKGWAFIESAKSQGAVRGVEVIQQKFASAISAALDRSDYAERFFPYVQLHELEALFYAEPETLAETLGVPTLAASFAKTVAQCGSCEEIDDDPRTAPSKRLQRLFPGYMKGRSDAAHAPRLARRLNLATVRRACPRFDAWLIRLESLAPQL